MDGVHSRVNAAFRVLPGTMSDPTREVERCSVLRY